MSRTRARLLSSIALLLVSFAGYALAQAPGIAASESRPARVSATTKIVPRLIKFSGTLLDAEGKPRPGTTGLTFALYKDQQGGSPLWLETQNVTFDAPAVQPWRCS